MSDADYGVQPTGFVRKPLNVILNELELSAMSAFGPDVIQTPQSPLGQLNGLLADLIAQLWEFAEDVYQSYDPDQAEGVRLEILGRLRLVQRAGDLDPDFRQAITNAGRGRVDIQDLVRALRNIDGVTFVNVTVDDPENVPLGYIAVAILGGDIDQIAATMRDFIVPGISTYGDTVIESNIDGYCRTLNLIRPELVPVSLNLILQTHRTANDCAPPAGNAIIAGLVEDLQLVNGQDVTWFTIRQLIESRFPTVEVIGFTGSRAGFVGVNNQTIPIAFLELATFSADDITVSITAA